MGEIKYKDDVYPEILRAPRITHARENIIQVLKDFNNATGKKDGKIVLNGSKKRGEDGIYMDNKYLLIKKNKTPLSAAKYSPYEKWHTIRKEVFNCLVDLLHDFDCLTVYDDRLLYKKPESNFHSHEYFLENDKNAFFLLHKLIGRYRTFTISTLDCDNNYITDNISPDKYMVMVGNMLIDFIEDGNYFTVESQYKHKNKKANYEYQFVGVPSFFQKQNSLLIQDKCFITKDRFALRNQILIPQIFTKMVSFYMEGTIQIIENNNIYYRSCVVERLKSDEDVLDTLPINDNRIPKKYRKILLNNSFNIFKASFM